LDYISTMRVVLLLIPVAGAVLLTGCGQSSSSSRAATSTTNNAQAGSAKANSVNTTPNYGGVLGQAQTFSENQIDLAQLKQAIQEFNAAEGRYPKDLQEMIPNYLAKIPAVPAGYGISYNPANGQVQVVRQQ
jgi:hypothetical protein